MPADKCPAVRDDAFLLEPFGDGDAPFAFRNDDHSRRIERPRALVLIVDREGHAADEKHEHECDGHDAADDANGARENARRFPCIETARTAWRAAGFEPFCWA